MRIKEVTGRDVEAEQTRFIILFDQGGKPLLATSYLITESCSEPRESTIMYRRSIV